MQSLQTVPALPYTVVKWETYERSYTVDPVRGEFRKTEIPHNVNIYGKQTRPWKSAARMKNEFLTLQFIRQFTNIPVPKPIYMEELDGAMSIVVEYIPGVPLDELPDTIRATAVEKATRLIEDNVLPQLRKLTSRHNGSLSGEVISPRRVQEESTKQEWSRIESLEPRFHFCHNDLAQHNILCDPQSGEVLAIIDWEYAGYYESVFEKPFWLHPFHEHSIDKEEISKLESLLSGTQSDRECAVLQDDHPQHST
ncbi:hypothetical protein OHC33_003347 [Knufia fluminis]|uniref:Aminoglycoside phosphotransferase domain-containing protein n=1 Tax=Knufia fluminis TaxID=191047 RepID=A0AAN8FCF1_9EURO|nr:hypothetical protein OHC33_003347 [Knufia fluminis]